MLLKPLIGASLIGRSRTDVAIVIVDRPLGSRVMPSLDARMRPMNEDLVARLLIRPAAEFLELIANQI